MKRVFLELGGKSAMIVLEDAPEFAMIVAQNMLVFHAGQGCAVFSRLLVPKSRYQEAVAILKHAYQAFSDKWGRIDDPASPMGPVVSKKQLDRVKAYIDLGVEEGATLAFGGQAFDRAPASSSSRPCSPSHQRRRRRARRFRKVMVVIPFEGHEDAIRIATTRLWDCRGVASTDLERARIASESLPFDQQKWGKSRSARPAVGGYKHSGIGRAWGARDQEYMERRASAGAKAD